MKHRRRPHHVRAGDRPGWHNDTSKAANKASRVPLRPGKPFPPLLTPDAPREKLEDWLAWADPNGLAIDWEDPEISVGELWATVKTLAGNIQPLASWSFGYNDDLNAFAATRYPRVPGRALLLVMTGEEGETPEPFDQNVDLTLLELEEDAAEWEEVHAALFGSIAEAHAAAETDPVWGIA